MNRESLIRWGPMAGLAVFTALSVGGYGYYALNPQNLPDSEAVRSFYATSFQFFGRAHIVLAALVLFARLVGAARAAWVVPFLATGVISFTAEYVGTGWGFPFGEYQYTGLLGPRIGSRVPWVIPVSWFLMALPSFALAAALTRRSNRAWSRIAVGAALLTAWDLALDPAMSFLTPYWLWGVEGAYYGMPAINLLGWFATGLVIMAALEGLRVLKWTDEVSLRWWAVYYGVMLALPVGMIAAAGLWLGVGVTFAGVAACVLVGRALDRAAPSREWRESPA